MQKLKARASAQGISTEEAHRRILREALSRAEYPKPSLIEFLSDSEVAPDLQLDLSRSRKIEERHTGF